MPKFRAEFVMSKTEKVVMEEIEHEGRAALDIRVWFWNAEEEEWMRTRKGVRFYEDKPVVYNGEEGFNALEGFLHAVEMFRDDTDRW